MGALFFDSDSDGDLDLYVVSGGVECKKNDPVLQDRLYINDGKGRFKKAPEGTLPKMLDSGGTVNCADFDGDGDLDLFVGGRVVPGEYPTSPNSYLLENNSGKFSDVTEKMAPSLKSRGMVTSAVWSDINNDQRPDLLVTYQWASIGVYINDNGKLFRNNSTTSGIGELWGWWNGICAGDIDNDGDMDFVVTNYGSNTKYKPKGINKPIRIFYGDFDGTGQSTIVEAKYENDVLLPVRGRSCSSHAMPFLLDKFNTFDSFARASLQEIYTPQKLDDSKIYKATELRSGILLNDGTGKFEFSALPRIVQIAPSYGVELFDYNGDTHLDIYMVQNFYGPEPETGHMAGGLSQLLTGDGTGNFKPVSPEESGLVVFEDTKSLTRKDMDGDGWKDLIIGVNNGNIKVFKNHNSGTNKNAIISLAGKIGNFSAIGARVTAQYNDGSSRVRELQAGSGYLSQNPSTIEFTYSTENPLKSISVIWPDGSNSNHKISDQEKLASLEIKQPQ